MSIERTGVKAGRSEAGALKLPELPDVLSLLDEYLTIYPQAPFDPADAETRYLLEALAWFSASSRAKAVEGQRGFYRRLFAQYFPTLLQPLPAAGLLEVAPTGQLAERVELPEGTEITLAAEGQGEAQFRTMAPLIVEPVWLERVDQRPLPDGGTLVRLHLRAAAPVAALHLQLNHLGDTLASARLFDELSRHMRGARVGAALNNPNDGEAVQHTLGGGPLRGALTQPETTDPLDVARWRLHFPERWSVLHLTLPERRVGSFCVSLNMGAAWEPDPWLAPRSFRLFVVPIENSQRAASAPIRCDGHRTAWPILPPRPGLSLVSVRGVYEVADAGLLPILPSALPGEGGTWELEPPSSLHLHLPDAFLRPRTISVDGLWHEPSFASALAGPLSPRLHRRAMPAVRLSMMAPPLPPRALDRVDDGLALLQVLSLRTRGALSLADLRGLLRLLGGLDGGPSREVFEHLDALHCEESVSGEGGGLTLVRRYTLSFPRLGRDAAFRVRAASAVIGEILSAWASQGRVTVRARMMNGEDA
ncbi:MAG: type VI secretion system baseplate subunit TssF [Deltaproteobacteria bacterium]|nr:type VI secretion system baseplate subunit TssF [Deltaproteobacteria bacterium]